ncbi:M15 family metallopeptidase [Kineosporia succinea]
MTLALLVAAACVVTTFVLKPTSPVRSLITKDAAARDIGAADGYVGAGSVDVHEDTPALTRLDPDLLAAVRRASDAAARDGIDLRVTSGWRSERYQQHLLDEAVAKYGSYAEARRWVATPQTSQHVTGQAVDIGPTDAADWTTRHGDDFGLCQVFANEMWHFELLTRPGGDCPPMRADGSSG